MRVAAGAAVQGLDRLEHCHALRMHAANWNRLQHTGVPQTQTRIQHHDIRQTFAARQSSVEKLANR
jgi:hypothetical protein